MCSTRHYIHGDLFLEADAKTRAYFGNDNLFYDAKNDLAFPEKSFFSNRWTTTFPLDEHLKKYQKMKGEIKYHLAAGADRPHDALNIFEKTPPELQGLKMTDVEMIRMSDIKMEKIDWLWPDRIDCCRPRRICRY
jgi:hypothetical protein